MIKRVVGFLWLLAVGLGSQALLPQTTTDWKPIGPPGAQVLSAAISPDDPDHFFIIAADPIRDSSLYETKDGGGSWNIVDTGAGPCFRVAWNEDAARSIYAVKRDGLLRSRDNGASWQFLPLGISGWGLDSRSRIAFAPPPRSGTFGSPEFIMRVISIRPRSWNRHPEAMPGRCASFPAPGGRKRPPSAPAIPISSMSRRPPKSSEVITEASLGRSWLLW